MSDTAPSLLSETLRGGSTWSRKLRRGQRLRITDIHGGGNLSLMLFNAEDPLERYNFPDSLKGQHTAFLTTGRVCYSDMGRVLMSFVEDGVGWHDTITGYSNAASVAAKLGHKSYQKHRNNFTKNGHDNFLVQLGKHGLGARDMTATVNLFTKVVTDDEGKLAFIEGHSAPGSSVTVRADMNTLVVATAIQHPMDPSTAYEPKDIQIDLLGGEPADEADTCRTSCEQNGRAFTLTEHYFI